MAQFDLLLFLTKFYEIRAWLAKQKTDSWKGIEDIGNDKKSFGSWLNCGTIGSWFDFTFFLKKSQKNLHFCKIGKIQGEKLQIFIWNIWQRYQNETMVSNGALEMTVLWEQVCTILFFIPIGIEMRKIWWSVLDAISKKVIQASLKMTALQRRHTGCCFE